MKEYGMYTISIDDDTTMGIEYYDWPSKRVISHSHFIRPSELSSYTELDVLLAIF